MFFIDFGDFPTNTLYFGFNSLWQKTPFKPGSLRQPGRATQARLGLEPPMLSVFTPLSSS
jgi:hypothetical protein